jgi:hypothetical protein
MHFHNSICTSDNHSIRIPWAKSLAGYTFCQWEVCKIHAVKKDVTTDILFCFILTVYFRNNSIKNYIYICIHINQIKNICNLPLAVIVSHFNPTEYECINAPNITPNIRQGMGFPCIVPCMRFCC